MTYVKHRDHQLPPGGVYLPRLLGFTSTTHPSPIMSVWAADTKDHWIEALRISFCPAGNRGGGIPRENFTERLQPALRTTASLKHLSLSFGEILDVDRSICYAILSRDVSKHPREAKIGLRMASGWEFMIGLCFLYFPHATDRNISQIGVALLPGARGKGYGRAAVHKLLAYAFEQLKV
ncbi:hypothetical protein FS749_014730, partial [Ceratobasidium sp. UAMH 11750]